MGFRPHFKVPANKYFRTAALIYGLVLFNIGALVLYDKISQSPVAFDATFRMGVGCLVLGGVGLYVAWLGKRQSG